MKFFPTFVIVLHLTLECAETQRSDVDLETKKKSNVTKIKNRWIKIE